MKMFKVEFRRVFLVLFCMFFSFFCLSDPLFAYDKNILIAPTRVVFEGKTRSTVVKLINPNNKPMTYNVRIVSLRMNESGKKEYVDSPNEEELLAQNMIRFSPRRVTIGPNVWQTVRVMVRKPKDLPPGEYRTQLRIVPIPDKEPTKEASNQNKLSINIKYAFSISIPIIVRHGEGDMTIISNTPTLIKKEENYFLETNLERTGPFSAYFDIDAFFTPSGKSERLEIGSCKGMTIYAKNPNLFVHVPVKNKDLLTQGKIEIEIRDREKKDKPLIHSKSYEINGMNVVIK